MMPEMLMLKERPILMSEPSILATKIPTSTSIKARKRDKSTFNPKEERKIWV